MKRKVLLSLILVCLLSACVATAQETRGAIVGRVSDPTGAVIPGASVVVTNVAMGTKVSLTTAADGFYQALFLQPGIYNIEVTAKGFKKLEREGIEVRLADRLEINLALEVGSSAESVTVTAEAPLMNTETASVGTLVDSMRVMTLPLSYGNPFLMTGLASGVAFVGDPRLDRPFEPTHIVNYAMSGTRGDLSDITIDGGPTTARTGSSVIAAYVPPTDAVAEFKVQTATFDASFGQTQGGVDQHDRQVRHQRSARYRLLLLLPAVHVGQRFFQQQEGRRAAAVHIQPLGRLGGRTDLAGQTLQRQEQDLLLLCVRRHSRPPPAV